jgi:predicted transcriptional regulator
MSKVKLHTGSIDDMGRRFVGAWKRASAGKRVDETHLTFLDLESMLATLSPKRLDLLRHVRRQGPASIKAIAEGLGRDYKNVHADVQALLAAGLLEKDGARIVAPWDEVSASLALT